MTKKLNRIALGFAIVVSLSLPIVGQQPKSDGEEFGPVVRAYLGYLKNEQEVVDDRVSRHEVSPKYYRRNSNRIRALREMALRIARESRNDFLPELEAVTRDELGLLFEKPPQPHTFKVGDVLKRTFRFMGTVRATELFYVFARLDPYEQAELLENTGQDGMIPLSQPVSGSVTAPNTGVRPSPRR